MRAAPASSSCFPASAGPVSSGPPVVLSYRSPSLYRFNRRLVHTRIEVFHEVPHELVLLDLGNCVRLFALPLAVGDLDGRIAAALAEANRDVHTCTVAFLKRVLESLLITFFEQSLVSARQHELDALLLELHELAMLGQHA